MLCKSDKPSIIIIIIQREVRKIWAENSAQTLIVSIQAMCRVTTVEMSNPSIFQCTCRSMPIRKLITVYFVGCVLCGLPRRVIAIAAPGRCCGHGVSQWNFLQRHHCIHCWTIEVYVVVEGGYVCCRGNGFTAGSIYVLMKPQITRGVGVTDIHSEEMFQMCQVHDGINDGISKCNLGQKGVRGSIVQKTVLRT